MSETLQPRVSTTTETDVSLGAARLQITRDTHGDFVEGCLTLSTSFLSVDDEDALRQLAAVLKAAGY